MIDFKPRFTLVACALIFAGSTIPVQARQQPPNSAQAKASAEQEKAPQKKRKRRRESPAEAKKRADALRAIMAKLKIGPGDTVADVGCGNGRDSWVFADVVGPQGKVYSEEIAKDKVETLKKEVAKRKLAQVQPVLGRSDDPCLPSGSANMIFMHYVYHHFSQPREMLAGLWRSLKPNGYLVIVDRHRGTLQDWVPRERRATKHFWIAETTVVREARETGFAVAALAEDCWPADDQFVLVFQRPLGAKEPGTDPDQAAPLDLKTTEQDLFDDQASFARPVIIALGRARALIRPILKHSSGQGVDVVLEEWATRKDERPPLPTGVSLPSVLTENGHVPLGDEPIDSVFFLDTYHLLFHQKTLLADLHQQLVPRGRIFVLDRKAEDGLSRREASHRRKIPLTMVKTEMAAAGFQLLAEKPAPAKDRFFLIFGKRDAGNCP